MTQQLAFQVTISAPLDQAIEAVTAALKTKGFGVLTRVDVHTTLKKKIDVDFRPYTILGVCSPSHAHQALSAEPLVGLLLPCTITIDEQPEGTLVSIMDPKVMSTFPQFAANKELRGVSEEVSVLMSEVAQALSDSSS